MQLGLVLAAVLATAVSPVLGCTLSLGTAGTLALSSDGTRLESSVAGGVAATFTVVNLSLGTATVTVSPPQLVAYPAGFGVGSASLAVAYSGSGVLGSVNQGYTGSTTQFSVPGLLSLAVLMNVDNRISNTAGFAAGTYQTRTVVTCSG
jgi:hypothetical protein